MISKKTKDWFRLDNAAIMFPSASTARNTRVFRITCQLTQEVDPKILQQALEKAAAQNPGFVCTMRSGLFWHYLERSGETPQVRRETFTPCSQIYSVNKKRLLFYVSYYRRRIHLEVYHALADGTGAVAFMRQLIVYYLLEAHGDELGDDAPAPGLCDSAAQRSEDSFRKHYSPQHGQARIHMPKALQIKGRRTGDKHYNIIEGAASAKELLALAHRYNTTITGLLCGLYMQAIATVASAVEKRRPVVITVPVDLRNIFPSRTLRNFFTTSNIAYDFSAGSSELADLTQAVTHALKSDEAKAALIARMNSLVSIQRNPFLRIAPLPLKDLAISISKSINVRGETAVLSNLGRMELPPALEKYVNLFSATSSTSNMHLCVLTYNDCLTMTFSSSFQENEVARVFFRSLTAEGVAVTLSSNYDQD